MKLSINLVEKKIKGAAFFHSASLIEIMNLKISEIVETKIELLQVSEFAQTRDLKIKLTQLRIRFSFLLEKRVYRNKTHVGESSMLKIQFLDGIEVMGLLLFQNLFNGQQIGRHLRRSKTLVFWFRFTLKKPVVKKIVSAVPFQVLTENPTVLFNL